jgi:hypothetical protein
MEIFMNAKDILKYGNRTLINSLEGMSEEQWYVEGVGGVWSTKDIIAHLASYERTLVEIFGLFLENNPTPLLSKMGADPGKFNDDEVALRKDRSSAEVLAEYNDAHSQAMSLVNDIPVEKLREVGTIPWYGPEYSLDDLIVYMFYGHKREHSAEIAVFRTERSG